MSYKSFIRANGGRPPFRPSLLQRLRLRSANKRSQPRQPGILAEMFRPLLAWFDIEI